jgi:lipopolysaccharide transport system ATP-binding protein
MSSNLAIKVDNLTKSYHIYSKPQDRLLQMLSMGQRRYSRDFMALNNVSFIIQKGETVGIIGRNGSGKSTLLQMICGTVTPSTGTVQTQGRVAALLELGAGFNTEFTGRENIFLNAAILGFSKEQMSTRIDDILSFSELTDFIDQPVKTYSSGMYARLAFSIAIHVDPEILIVDEALAVGDARFVSKCMRRIKDMQQLGMTILFVSHDVGSVRTLCDRAIWLDKGVLREDGDVFPVTGKYMEYIFQDDSSDAEILRDEILHHEPSGEDVLADPASPQPLRNATSLPPITHWGTHKGIIRSASILDQNGSKKDVINWSDDIEVAIHVRVPLEISRESLSIAFSIKDLKGTDVVVSTTHDFGVGKLPSVEEFTVSFKLNNMLTTGKYLLVAAVENREYRDIHYYEYVEGAHYFSSLADERLFGIYHPPITQQITAA